MGQETWWHRWNNAKPSNISAGKDAGNIVLVDTATGKQVGDWTLPAKTLPYAVFPGTEPLQGMVLTGGFNRPQHFWAEIDLESGGSRATVRKGAMVDKYYNEVQMPVC